MTHYNFRGRKCNFQNDCKTCDPKNQFISEFGHLLWIIVRFFTSNVQFLHFCTFSRNFHKKLKNFGIFKISSRWKVHVMIKTGWRDFNVQNLNYKIKGSCKKIEFFLKMRSQRNLILQSSKMAIFWWNSSLYRLFQGQKFSF